MKFSFTKGNLSIIEAPFDVGIKMSLQYGSDYIDLFPQAVYEIPERKYAVISLVNDNSLVLGTKNNNNETIHYYFINQKRLLAELTDKRTIDEGLIVIKHLKLSEIQNALIVFQST